MAKNAFLYTGVTFLIMMTLLISVNYLFLSKHTVSESKSVNLEIDSVNNLLSDARSILFTSPNNTMSDAMSDLALYALKVCPKSGAVERNLVILSFMLDPKSSVSTFFLTNFSKWFLNYSNLTLYEIGKASTLPINFSAPTPNLVNSYAKLGVTLDYFIDMSYNVTVNSTINMQLNQTMRHGKELTVNWVSTGSVAVYQIKVIDNETGVTDFLKRVACDSATCTPCPTC